MLGLLMQSKNLKVVKIALTVVAPGSFQDLVERGTTSLLAHCDYEVKGGEFRRKKPGWTLGSIKGKRASKVSRGSIGGEEVKSLQIALYGDHGWRSEGHVNKIFDASGSQCAGPCYHTQTTKRNKVE